MFANVLLSFNRSMPKLTDMIKHTNHTIKMIVFFMIIIM